jgi:hypothetical protein
MKLCEVDIPPTFKTSPQSPTDTDFEKGQDEAHEPECSHVC